MCAVKQPSSVKSIRLLWRLLGESKGKHVSHIFLPNQSCRLSFKPTIDIENGCIEETCPSRYDMNILEKQKTVSMMGCEVRFSLKMWNNDHLGEGHVGRTQIDSRFSCTFRLMMNGKRKASNC